MNVIVSNRLKKEHSVQWQQVIVIVSVAANHYFWQGGPIRREHYIELCTGTELEHVYAGFLTEVL